MMTSSKMLQEMIEVLGTEGCWHIPKSAETWDHYVPPTKISFHKGRLVSDQQPNPVFMEYLEGFMHPTLNKGGQALFRVIKEYIKTMKLSKTIYFVEMSRNISMKGE